MSVDICFTLFCYVLLLLRELFVKTGEIHPPKKITLYLAHFPKLREILHCVLSLSSQFISVEQLHSLITMTQQFS